MISRETHILCKGYFKKYAYYKFVLLAVYYDGGDLLVHEDEDGAEKSWY